MESMNNDFNLISVSLNHLHDLKELTPPDWNSDISLFFRIHYGEKYLYAIGFEFQEKLAACGFAIMNGNIAWLGNIVVSSSFRNKGFGTMITSSLVEHCKNSGCITQVLVATKLGEPIYKKLGFQTEEEYIFFKGSITESEDTNSNVRKISEEDFEIIYKIDFNATAENRRYLLKKFLRTGFIHLSDEKKIDGFFLPDFGNGFIVGLNNKAGIDLLKLKNRNAGPNIVVPSKNEIAIKFLRENNFREFLKAPRMILGEKINWKPEFIYSRAAGYCG